ncbi:MAG TPA: PIG-L deacetylase family protein [Thermodesulfobacteriota bacterium]|nr:PIG-L deacetylase family protein [Thermodesulfobacteriota bacterium]
MSEYQTYLMVVSPHPDDGEFGIAGTVSKLVKEGKSVVYVICTNGDKGTSDRNLTPTALAEIRKKEQLAAAELLGVGKTVFLNFPDQGLEDGHPFRRELVRVIRRFRPLVVATADPYRKYLWHRDHRITGIVSLDAVFPFARDHLAYPELLEEGLEPHKVKEIWFWGADQPNYRIDLTETLETKFAALACHKSQVGDLSPELKERILDYARRNAKDEPFDLAEAFYKLEINF